MRGKNFVLTGDALEFCIQFSLIAKIQYNFSRILSCERYEVNGDIQAKLCAMCLSAMSLISLRSDAEFSLWNRNWFFSLAGDPCVSSQSDHPSYAAAAIQLWSFSPMGTQYEKGEERGKKQLEKWLATEGRKQSNNPSSLPLEIYKLCV